MPGSKEKLDTLLGIASDKSIEDVLAELDTESASIGEAVKESAEQIDKDIKEMTENKSQLTFNEQFKIDENISKNLDNINELIELSKNVIKHLYTNIISTDLIDPELIQAAASFIESTRANISEYLAIYKDRQKFYEKIHLEMLKHKNNLEILEKKYELEAKKLANGNMLDGTAENLQSYDQTKLVKLLRDVEEGNT